MYEDIFTDIVIPDSLEKKELEQLFIKKSNGDLGARNKIIKHNIRLVIRIVMQKFKYINYDYQDLISIGIIGLIKAVDTYNVDLIYPFAGYASKCIENEIFMFLRGQKKKPIEKSLEEVVGYDKNDDAFLLKDTLYTETDFTDDIVNKFDYEIIKKFLDTLPYREKETILLYFGFHDNKRYTLEEIGIMFNVSKSFIGILKDRALKKLKNYIESCNSNSKNFNEYQKKLK